jgi:hypothetical protein
MITVDIKNAALGILDELKAKGHSNTDIANRLECGETQVSRWLNSRRIGKTWARIIIEKLNIACI